VRTVGITGRLTAVPVRSRRFRRALPHLLVASALLLGACAGERPELGEAKPTSTTASDTTTTSTTVPEPEGAEIAQARESTIDVFATEDATTPERQIVSGVDTSVDTIPIVFLVKTEGDERHEVYLPVRPNGSFGWVNASDVTVSHVPYRIEVGISEHRIRVFEDDEVIVDEPVGVGRQDRPTPGGVYYLKELLAPPNPGGVYGPYAYGLSGFSNVLTSFNGGPGVIGIHGTNEPAAIGSDVSSGCIRLHNDVITKLVEEIGLPLGTPVEIIA
jgi:lipoprotein-anchoring transpeptidase ErfK/SrfK